MLLALVWVVFKPLVVVLYPLVSPFDLTAFLVPDGGHTDPPWEGDGLMGCCGCCDRWDSFDGPRKDENDSFRIGIEPRFRGGGGDRGFLRPALLLPLLLPLACWLCVGLYLFTRRRRTNGDGLVLGRGRWSRDLSSITICSTVWRVLRIN